MDQLHLERLHIDEQLRQFGGGAGATGPRNLKDKSVVMDNGVDPGTGRGAGGRSGRGRGGEAFMASGVIMQHECVFKGLLWWV